MITEPLPGTNEKLYKRFMKYVNKTDSCWIWTARKIPKGYGYFKINKKWLSTHRVSWLLHCGDIPEGMCVLHKCDTPSCVNPNCLFLGTQKENIHDMLTKKRNNPTKGEKVNTAKLTIEKVLEILNSTDKTTSELAKQYNVHYTTIDRIIKREIWKHVI